MSHRASRRCALWAASIALPFLSAWNAACGAADMAGWKPERAVELVAPSAPGGGTDRTARLIQQLWQDKHVLDVPITVVNKPGGSGAVSLTYLMQHNADPQVLNVASAVLLTNHIRGASPYSYTDFTVLPMLNSEYVVFAVKADSPIKTLQDLIGRLRKDVGSVSIAVGTSLGGANHVAIAMAARAAGADLKKLKTVVFKSSVESAIAVLGGHVDLATSSASLFMAHVRSGAMRILAVTSPQRLGGDLSAVPTLKELGIDTVIDNFRLMIGPAGFTPAQIAFWDEAIGKAVRSDEWKKDLARNGWENTYRPSRDTKAYLEEQYSQLKAALTDLGLAK